MKNILNQLVQLQELSFARDEQKAANTQAPLKQLDEAIAELQKKLPEEITERYRRLRLRAPLVVVPVTHGSCSQCGLALPPALVNVVRAGEEVSSCPHCGRFLYHLESPPRRPKKPGSGDERPRPGVARFSAPELMVPRLTASTREEAICELAETLAAKGFIENAAVMNDLALHREAIVSTAVEHGLAFPHVRNVEGGGLTFALGLKPKGLDFGAPDGVLSKIIFFIIIPAPASAFYLRLLAGLVKTFNVTEARKALLDCDTAEAMWRTLTKLTRITIP